MNQYDFPTIDPKVRKFITASYHQMTAARNEPMYDGVHCHKCRLMVGRSTVIAIHKPCVARPNRHIYLCPDCVKRYRQRGIPA